MALCCATCGRGLHKFARLELMRLFGIEPIHIMDGKVLFHIDDPKKVLMLKTVERVLIVIMWSLKDEFEASTGQDVVKRVMSFHSELRDAVKLWRDNFQNDDVDKVIAPQEGSVEDGCVEWPRPSKRLRTRRRISPSGGQAPSPLNEVQASRPNVLEDNACTYSLSDANRVQQEQLQKRNAAVPSCSDTFLITDHPVDAGCYCRVPGKQSPGPAGGSVTSVDLRPSVTGDWESHATPVAGVAGVSETVPDARMMGSCVQSAPFRVFVKVTGKYRTLIQREEVAQCLGQWVTSELPFCSMDLRRPQFTINVVCSEEVLLVGIPVTSMPLSLRPYIHTFGLRSTVCSAMIYLADIKPGDICLDPMCGAATLLMEARHIQPSAIHLGIDIDACQLRKAEDNIAHFTKTNRKSGHTQLFLGDSTNLPFPDGCIDALITDMPFGLKHSTVEKITLLYPQCLMEFCRVLSPNGRIVLLISVSCYSLVSDSLSQGMHVTGKYYLTLGHTEAYIVTISKNRLNVDNGIGP